MCCPAPARQKKKSLLLHDGPAESVSKSMIFILQAKGGALRIGHGAGDLNRQIRDKRKYTLIVRSSSFHGSRLLWLLILCLPNKIPHAGVQVCRQVRNPTSYPVPCVVKSAPLQCHSTSLTMEILSFSSTSRGTTAVASVDIAMKWANRFGLRK